MVTRTIWPTIISALVSEPTMPGLLLLLELPPPDEPLDEVEVLGNTA